MKMRFFVVAACVLLVACGSDPAKPGVQAGSGGSGGGEATGGTTGTGGTNAGTGGSTPAGSGGAMPMDTMPGVDVQSPPKDDCGPAMCRNAIEFKDSALKDSNSQRGMIGRQCWKDGKVQDAVFTLDKTCAFAETCQLQDGKPACVSCGAKGQSYFKETRDGAITKDCEGCKCEFSFQCLGPGVGAPNEASVQVRGVVDVFITASGNALPPKAGQKIEVRAVNKLNIMPGGELDIELVTDGTVMDSFGRMQAVHTEQRLMGNCVQ
jgi:hypothetical protein